MMWYKLSNPKNNALVQSVIEDLKLWDATSMEQHTTMFSALNSSKEK